MPVYIRVAPENAEATAQIVDKTIADMNNAKNISDDEVLKVKQYMLKSTSANIADNSYWYAVLKIYARFGLDLNSGFVDAVNSLSPKSIANFAHKNLVPKTKIHLSMNPQ
jgi:hypothetical protein